MKTFINNGLISLFMNRKLIKQGKGGFTIYLPKKWVDNRGLKEGESIDIYESDDFLIVGSDKKQRKEIKIDISEINKKDLKHMLTHLYRRGFDVIKLHNLDTSLISKVRKITEALLLGFELTEKGEDYCVLENISEPTEQKYELLLKRSFLLIKDTIELIINDFGKYESSKENHSLMIQQEKFVLFCRRILNREKYIKNALVEWELLTHLMHIEHALYYMYEYAINKKVKKDFDIIRTLINLRDQFDLVYNAYYKKDLKFIHYNFNARKEYCFVTCFDNIEKFKGTKAGLFAHLRGVFRWVQATSSPIMSKLLQENVRES